MADLTTSFPTSPSFQAVNFKLNTPSQTSETFSGKFRRVGFGVSYYSFEVQYPQLTPIEGGTVIGFVAQAFGPQLSFSIVLPEVSYSKLTSLQTTNIIYTNTAGSILVGNKSISVRNAGANQYILAAGDFFKFSNHSKVYMCVSPCQADGSGNATLFFSGGLVADVPNGTALTITAVPFTCALDNDLQEWTVGFGGMTSMSLSMREVW
jgi:hypothetical protein